MPPPITLSHKYCLYHFFLFQKSFAFGSDDLVCQAAETPVTEVREGKESPGRLNRFVVFWCLDSRLCRSHLLLLFIPVVVKQNRRIMADESSLFPHRPRAMPNPPMSSPDRSTGATRLKLSVPSYLDLAPRQAPGSPPPQRPTAFPSTRHETRLPHQHPPAPNPQQLHRSPRLRRSLLFIRR